MDVEDQIISRNNDANEVNIVTENKKKEEKIVKENENKEINYIKFKWDKNMIDKKLCDTKHMLYLLQLALELVCKHIIEKNEYWETIGSIHRCKQILNPIQIITNFIKWHNMNINTNLFDGKLLHNSTKLHIRTQYIAKIGGVKAQPASATYNMLTKQVMIETEKWLQDPCPILKLKTYGFIKWNSGEKYINDIVSNNNQIVIDMNNLKYVNSDEINNLKYVNNETWNEYHLENKNKSESDSDSDSEISESEISVSAIEKFQAIPKWLRGLHNDNTIKRVQKPKKSYNNNGIKLKQKARKIAKKRRQLLLWKSPRITAEIFSKFIHTLPFIQKQKIWDKYVTRHYISINKILSMLHSFIALCIKVNDINMTIPYIHQTQKNLAPIVNAITERITHSNGMIRYEFNNKLHKWILQPDKSKENIISEPNMDNNSLLRRAFATENKETVMSVLKSYACHFDLSELLYFGRDKFEPQPLVSYKEAMDMLMNKNCCFGMYDDKSSQWRTVMFDSELNSDQILVRFCYKPKKPKALCESCHHIHLGYSILICVSDPDDSQYHKISNFPVNNIIINDPKRFFVGEKKLRESNVGSERINIDEWVKRHKDEKYFYERKAEYVTKSGDCRRCRKMLNDIMCSDMKIDEINRNIVSDANVIMDNIDGIGNDNDDYKIFNYRAEKVYCAVLIIEQYSIMNKDIENMINNMQKYRKHSIMNKDKENMLTEYEEKMEISQIICEEMDNLLKRNMELTADSITHFIDILKQEHKHKRLHLYENELKLNKLDMENEAQKDLKVKERDEKYMNTLFKPQNKKYELELERIVNTMYKLQSIKSAEYCMLLKSKTIANDMKGLKESNFALQKICDFRRVKALINRKHNQKVHDTVKYKIRNEVQKIRDEMRPSNVKDEQKTEDKKIEKEDKKDKKIEKENKKDKKIKKKENIMEIKREDAFTIDRKNFKEFRNILPFEKFDRHHRFGYEGFEFKVGLYPNGKQQFGWVSKGMVIFFVRLLKIPLNVLSVVIHFKLYCKQTNTLYYVTKMFYQNQNDNDYMICWDSNLSFAHCKQYNYLKFGYEVQILQIERDKNKMINIENYSKAKLIPTKTRFDWYLSKHMSSKIRHFKKIGSKKICSFYADTCKIIPDLGEPIGFSLRVIGGNVYISFHLLKLPAKAEKYEIAFALSVCNCMQRSKAKIQQTIYEMDYTITECIMKLNDDQTKMILSSQYKQMQLKIVLIIHLQKWWIRDYPEYPIIIEHQKLLDSLKKMCEYKNEKGKKNDSKDKQLGNKRSPKRRKKGNKKWSKHKSDSDSKMEKNTKLQ